MVATLKARDARLADDVPPHRWLGASRLCIGEMRSGLTALDT
jgi:hypothetical protein